MTQYKNLFSPIRVGRTVLKNRLVMPAMDTLFCNADGTVTETLRSYYAKRAEGGVGMIILEFGSVDQPHGMGSVVQLDLSKDTDIPGLHAIADSVKPYGTKILAQLHHAGSRSVSSPGSVAVAPDAGKGYAALTKEEIDQLVKKYVAAARRAQQAGLDGVEIHAGHGYLVNQFLSPLTNHRTDEYGGDVENRFRFLGEVLSAVRAACGEGFLLSVRLAVQDWAPGGIDIDMGAEYAKLADPLVDMINVTTGIKDRWFGATETQDRPDGARRPLVAKIKPVVKKPVAIVGKIRTGEMCEEILENNEADLIVVGRQLICDPYFPEKLRTGKENEIRRCINCLEGCYAMLGKKSGIRCALNPYVGFDAVYDEGNLPTVRAPKNIVVVGGGVAGMQAAQTAAERGHKVTLIEKKGFLGGQMNIASVPPDKEILNTTAEYFERQFELLGVKVLLNTEATVDSVAALAPDKVIVAVGAVPATPPLPGVEHTVGVWDVLDGTVPTPKAKDVVVIGGGNVGCEAALYLLEHGNRITIIEMAPVLSAGQEATHRERDLAILKESGSNLQVSARVSSIEPDGVNYVDSQGVAQRAKADLIVLATGQRPAGGALQQALEEKGINAVCCGDALEQGNIRTNVAAGFRMGYYA
ncbi:MAG: FAD-dependent oxidoreductase [Christensenellales bacterium]